MEEVTGSNPVRFTSWDKCETVALVPFFAPQLTVNQKDKTCSFVDFCGSIFSILKNQFFVKYRIDYKELSALLARDLLVPIVHNTKFEALREVSPLLGSRSGLSTIEDTMEEITSKLPELITV